MRCLGSKVDRRRSHVAEQKNIPEESFVCGGKGCISNQVSEMPSLMYNLRAVMCCDFDIQKPEFCNTKRMSSR